MLERGLSSLDARMQAHFDRARALAEYLAANEMVRNVRYPGLSSHPDHVAATGLLEHGSGRFAGRIPHITRRRLNNAPFGPAR